MSFTIATFVLCGLFFSVRLLSLPILLATVILGPVVGGIVGFSIVLILCTFFAVPRAEVPKKQGTTEN